MKINNIKTRRVSPVEGLEGFASCVVDDSLFLGNIAIFSRLNRPGEYRVVFPVKDCPNGKRIEIFYPLTKDSYYELENAIVSEFIKNNESPDNKD
jgi:DNA-binding cell septation regulator SpoVG